MLFAASVPSVPAASVLSVPAASVPSDPAASVLVSADIRVAL